MLWQEDCHECVCGGFQASLGYRVRPRFKKEIKKGRGKKRKRKEERKSCKEFRWEVKVVLGQHCWGSGQVELAIFASGSDVDKQERRQK